MSSTKRAREDDDGVEEVPQPVAGTSKLEDLPEDSEGDSEDDLEGLEMEVDSDEEDNDDEDDDEDDIIAANEDAQTHQKKKRKRALPQPVFGSLLSSLISAPAPTKPLRPLHPPPSSEALEKKALKQLTANRHEREERGHVSDVIAGWSARPNVPFSQWSRLEMDGQQDDSSSNANAVITLGGSEKEKELRRLAQRGAVRLFNAIKAAQTTEAEANGTAPTTRVAAIKGEAASGAKRSIKESSPAGSVASSASTAASAVPEGGVVTRKANMLGSRGKQEALANLSKASFLELFKSGTTAKPKIIA